MIAQGGKTMGTLFFFGYLMLGIAIYGILESHVDDHE